MIPANNKTLRKSSSGHSLTSTLNSLETNSSDASTLATEVSDDVAPKATISVISMQSAIVPTPNSGDRGLHQQIEELLTELSKVQRQRVQLGQELQREREGREEDRVVARRLAERLQQQTADIKELVGEEESEATEESVELDTLLEQAERRFSVETLNRLSMVESKHQLRDAVSEWREKHDAEAVKCRDLSRQLDEREAEQNSLKDQLKDARARIQDAHRDKQRLERTISDLRSRSSAPDSPADLYTPVTEFPESKLPPPKANGLRELRLGRPEPTRSSSIGPSGFSKRCSSLNTQAVLATENQEPVSNDALLLELVNSKTAEAVARQELEETKGKLDALRKIIGGSITSPTTRNSESPTACTTTPSPGTKEPVKATHNPSASTGGFFSGWGKRST